MVSVKLNGFPGSAEKWWICCYEQAFPAGKTEEEQKRQEEAMKKLVDTFTEHGFKRIRVRPSPIIKGL